MSARARRAAERRGHWAEILAALWLTVKGYRIQARRARNRYGEIDLIAVRGRVVAFVEVKQRADRQASGDVIGSRSERRIADAAEAWLAKRRDLACHDMRFDLVIIAPWSWPKHFHRRVASGGLSPRRDIVSMFPLQEAARWPV